MPYSLEGKLVVGITSRALFDLAEANEVFVSEGIEAYRAYQREHEDEPLDPGTAFPLVQGLLKVNDLADEPLVEVLVMSRNDPDSGTRIFRSAEAHGLNVTRGAFTDGREIWPYLKPFNVTLLLSAEADQVVRAIEEGHPAALVLPPPETLEEDVEEVRIAFDGDAVLFDDESERVYQEQGLEAFQARERELADVPMSPGPFEPFLRALQRIQSKFPPDKSPVRIALVTARNAPADRRVINTLRHWGVRVDEAFFLGGIKKAEVLAALRPHIFFDDQMTHLEPASRAVSSAHVPYGVGQQAALFDPAEPSGTPEGQTAED